VKDERGGPEAQEDGGKTNAEDTEDAEDYARYAILYSG
jgi:hypothetical protein